MVRRGILPQSRLLFRLRMEKNNRNRQLHGRGTRWQLHTLGRGLTIAPTAEQRWIWRVKDGKEDWAWKIYAYIAIFQKETMTQRIQIFLPVQIVLAIDVNTYTAVKDNVVTKKHTDRNHKGIPMTKSPGFLHFYRGGSKMKWKIGTAMLQTNCNKIKILLRYKG